MGINFLNISRTVGLMTTCETVVVGTIRRALGCTGVGVEHNRVFTSLLFKSLACRF
jgi:hypothetical protein